MKGRDAAKDESYLSSHLRNSPPFVGRRWESNWLMHCLQEAIDGRPKVVMISGEAGIGKTRLLNEVQADAFKRGVRTFYCRCYEDLALPYLPFIETLLAQVDKDAEEINHRLSDALEVISEFLDRHKSAIPTSSLLQAGQSDQDKLHLLIAVARVMITLAQMCPTLLIVDDLHWADPPSLDLFGHLVFTVADTAVKESVPLLILGTYRPEDREERLIRLTDRIQREVICETLDLPGLNEAEVHQLVQGMGLKRPSHQLITTINDAAHGNALFAQEIIYHLRQQRVLQERGGYVVTTSSLSDLTMPNHIIGALVARMNGLSEACRHFLSIAACLGGDLSVKLLHVVSGMNEDEVLDLLDEAMRHHLVLSQDQACQFAHPLIRHAFYDELTPIRRQHLHWQIAQTLEHVYADSLDGHILEIAHHLIRAGSAADPNQIVYYARLAGDQTYRLFAWDESARYYEAVLSMDEVSHRLSSLDRGHLHYLAGRARYRHMDVGPCRDHYEKAIETYRTTHYIQGLAQVLVEKTRILFSLESVPWGTLIDLQPLEDVLAALSEDESGLRASISSVMAEVYRVGGQLDQAEVSAQQALDMSRHLCDDSFHSRAHHVLALVQNQNMKLVEAVDNWQYALTYARRADDLWCLLWPLQRLSWTLMQMAKLEDAEVIAQEACELAQKTQDWGNHSLALAALVSVAVTRGDFDLAERHSSEIMTLMYRSRYPWGGARALFTLACARTAQGDWTQAESALNLLMEPGEVFENTGEVIETWIRIYRQLLHAYTGLSVEAIVEHLADNLLESGTSDLFNLAPLCALVEIGDLMASPVLAARPYPVLMQAVERGVIFSSWWVFLLPRILGVAATLNEWWDQAEAHFLSAMDIAIRVGAKPELGRTYLNYARMLILRNGATDRPRALGFVQHAEVLFEELGMHPYLMQAQQLAEMLQSFPTLASVQLDPQLDDTNAHETAAWLHMALDRTSFLR